MGKQKNLNDRKPDEAKLFLDDVLGDDKFPYKCPLPREIKPLHLIREPRKYMAEEQLFQEDYGSSNDQRNN